MNSAPLIIYSTGAGGQWLSAVIHCLETNYYCMPQPEINFHDHTKYPKTHSIIFGHNTTPGIKELVKPNTGSLHGLHSHFIVYVNEMIKNPPLLSDKSLSESLFHHSNNATWRINGSADLEYAQNIKFNLDLIFTDQAQFVKQLYNRLYEYSIEFTPNDEFVFNSIETYTRTCLYKKYFSNLDTIIWHGWCHALCLYHKIDIPVNISTDYNGFVNFLQKNNQQFIDLTKKTNIV